MHLWKVDGVDVNDLGEKQSDKIIKCFINLDEIKAIVMNGDIGHISFISGGNMAVTRKSINLIRRETCKNTHERITTLKTIQSEYYEEYCEKHSENTSVHNLTKNLATQVIVLMADISTEKDVFNATKNYSALGPELLGVDNITSQISKHVKALCTMTNNQLPHVSVIKKEEALKLINAFFQEEIDGSISKKTNNIYQEFLGKHNKSMNNRKEKETN